jgi:serine protease inhibitor
MPSPSRVMTVIMAVSIVLSGCAPVQKEYPVNPEQVTATNAMGLDLLQRLSAIADPGTNVFISPVSVALALGMAANGASGDTFEGMLAAMHLGGWDEASVNEAMAGLAQELNDGDLGVDLITANSLWLRQGLPFRQSYLDAVDAYYAARVASLDFSSDSAPKTINAWVAKQTRNRIAQIVTPPIDPLAILFVINAVYFKGDWKDPFDEALTEVLPFTRADGSLVEAPLMSNSGSYDYADGGEYQVVRLSYAGDRLSMIVALPAEGADVDQWVAKLDADAWSALTEALSDAEGNVVLPRFTLSFEVVLNELLADMGMGLAMSPGEADFTRLHDIDQPTWIDQVRHKTFVEVNEKGTEAAAATSIGIAMASLPEDAPFSFVANRPFVYAIRDDLTGAVLFIGVLHDPLQTEAQVVP